MDTAQFTDAVRDLVAAARADLASKPFSDILDDAGNQYVDLVMGGGGVLGIALVGYTYLLEEVGIRFLRVGGTSAGSINALGIAALGPPAEAKSGKLLTELAGLNVWSFVDGPASAKALITDFLNDRSTLFKAFDVLREYHHISTRLGLNPGQVFRDWMAGVLERAGIGTTADLAARMHTLPALVFRGGGALTAADADPKLGMVATDITTETKAVFPQMARFYWADPDRVNPADFVRASMSIPFFFEPFRVTGVPRGPAAEAAWRAVVKNDRYPPAECAFVDGGVLSNFPIDMFHDPDGAPTAPTFGVKLGADARPVEHFDRLVQLTLGVFNSARHALDNDFLLRNPDFRQLVCVIDTGEQSWLNFGLTDAEKVDLFRRGAAAAVAFLRGFEWEAYKRLRAVRPAVPPTDFPAAPGLRSAGPQVPH